MTHEAQRIAIAEACGWKHILKDPVFFRGTPPWLSIGLHEISDYLNDLNAMHEAEKVLNPEQLSEYYIQRASAMFRPFRASAAQRAEALLRTLGKWKETSK
jgi:hypothetical protein